METTEFIIEEYKKDPDAIRCLGKKLAFSQTNSDEERWFGKEIIKTLYFQNDPEATYLLGILVYGGQINPVGRDTIQHGMELIQRAANMGCIAARTMLNSYYENKYRKSISEEQAGKKVEGPLTGVDGKIIKIDRTGIRTPVDAQLKYVEGKNILTLSFNLKFIVLDDEMPDSNAFAKAVCKGIKDWEGEYEVFGGQKLKVKIEFTFEDRMLDNVQVIPVTPSVKASIMGIYDKIGIHNENGVRESFETNRSFATTGMKKWSVTSRKKIFILAEDFKDYDEIRHVAKHEFGHVLGLGDMYFSPKDGLDGVQKDKYPELEAYRINEHEFNLVMCDHHAPISNNDIEMVVLAFSENCRQNYQQKHGKGEISEALGKGN